MVLISSLKFNKTVKVNGPFVQTLCIDKDSYIDVI